MDSNRAIGIVDGVLGNFVTDAVKKVVSPWSENQQVVAAIRRTAGEFPFTDVTRCLHALLEQRTFGGPDGRVSDDELADLVVRYAAISQITGNTVDDAEAQAIVRRFIAHLDNQRLRLGDHDLRQRERHEEQLEAIAALGTQLKVVLNHQGSVTNSSQNSSFSEVDRHISIASALVDAGLFEAADAQLGKLPPGSLSDDQEFRVATLSGICAYECGDYARAVEQFRLARDQKPQNAGAASNLAAAYLTQNNYAKAIEEAHIAWQLDPRFKANYISALYAVGDTVHIETLVPDIESVEEGDTLLALARVNLATGDYRTAETIARRATAIAPSAEIKETLALSVLGIHGFSTAHTPVSTLCEADRLLSEAVEERRSWQPRHDVPRYLANRAVVRALKRDYADALKDVEEALRTEQPPEVRLLRARLLFVVGRRGEALADFEAIAAESPSEDMRLPFAHCLVHAGKPKQALAYIESSFEAAKTAADRLDVIQVAIEAAHLLKDVTVAGRYVDQMSGDGADGWALLAAEGYVALKDGDLTSAIAKLNAAASRAPVLETVPLRINLARAYARAGRWIAASTTYLGFVTVESDIELVVSLAVSLYRAGRYAELLDLLVACDDHALRVRELTDLRARLYEHAGDLRSARQMYLRNAASADGKSEDYLRAAIAAWRVQDIAAATLVERVAVGDLVDEPRLLMSLAELQSGLGLDPLQAAYCANAQNESAPDVPAKYVRLYRSWRKSEPTPKVMAPGVTATLEFPATGSTIVLTLTDDTIEERLREHVSLASPRGQALVGRAVGDIVALPFDGRSAAAKIARLEHRFDFSFRDAIENSWRRFGSAAQVAALDNEYALGVYQTRTETRERRAKALAKYRQNAMTLGAAADRSGISAIRFFCREMFEGDGAVQAFTGDPTEAQEQRVAASGASEVVVDLTAIITLARLDALNLLASRFKVLVTQATIDALLFTRTEFFESSTVPTVGVLEDGKIQPKAVDPMFYANERAILDRCLSFIRSHAAIISVSSVLALTRRDYVRLARKYGREGAMAVLAARESGAVLLFDDVVTQRLARQEGIPSAGTHVCLELWRQEGVLAPDEYIDHIAALSALNYHFVRVGAGDLYRAFQRDLREQSGAFPSLLARLGDSDCSARSAIAVAADLVKGLCQSAAPVEQRRAAIASAVLAPSLRREAAIGWLIRDTFLTTVARDWYEANGRLDGRVREAVGAMHYWLIRLEEARKRVGGSDKVKRVRRGARLSRSN